MAAWRELEAPYEGARVRVLLGQVLRVLGDDDTAAQEPSLMPDVYAMITDADPALVARIALETAATG